MQPTSALGKGCHLECCFVEVLKVRCAEHVSDVMSSRMRWAKDSVAWNTTLQSKCLFIQRFWSVFGQPPRLEALEGRSGGLTMGVSAEEQKGFRGVRFV